MWKTVLAGTVALAVVGTSLVYAQQRTRGSEPQQRPQFSQEDRAAFAAARIAALKAGLTLNADQERNWPAFEGALKDLSQFRMQQRSARQNVQPSNDPTERMRRRADLLSGYGAALKKLADAQAPLYNSLTDAQKRRFAVLESAIRHSHGMRQGHHRHHRMGEDRRRNRDMGSERRRFGSNEWDADRPHFDAPATTGAGDSL